MRITFAQSYNKSVRDINTKRESLDRLTTMASSGKRLIKPNDDPIAWSQSMKAKINLRELDSYYKNIEFSTGWNDSTEDALNSMSDVLLRAKNAAIEFVSAISPEKKDALVQTLDQAIEEATGLANSKYGDQYLFGGKNPSTAPFDSTDFTVYHGDADDLEVRTGSNQLQTVNVNGETAFFTNSGDPSSSILQTLVDMRDAMQLGNSSGVQTQMAELDAGYDHLTTVQTLVGTRLAKLDHQQTTLGALKLQGQTRISDLEDADLADVLTRLQQQHTTLEAALKVTTYMNDLSLAKMI
jgi:flagellar hook-associated protein 3 FlgL